VNGFIDKYVLAWKYFISILDSLYKFKLSVQIGRLRRTPRMALISFLKIQVKSRSKKLFSTLQYLKAILN